MDVIEQADSQQLHNEANASLNAISEDTIIDRSEVLDDDTEEMKDIEGYNSLSEQELVAKAKEIVEKNEGLYAPLKNRLDAIKHCFYRSLRNRHEELKKKFIEEGGLDADFSYPAEPLEQELKSILSVYREKKNEEIQKIEKQKADNLVAKNKILDELKGLLENNEDYGKKVPAFQKLQQDWRSIGQVPASEVNTLWKNYQYYVETFYDNLKINNELREYDFKKNLEQKTELCEMAEALASETDVVGAFKKLQTLHEKWREIGPVSKENRESIWERFKAASTVVNKKHHDFFDELRESENENLVKKTAICEKIESVDIEKISSYKDWQDNTETILALQEDWRKIGFAPRKDNVAIYERFRSACDRFFNAKNEFYKETKERMSENLAKKIKFCEKAEALKDSEDWKSTSDKLIQLQKDWKTIGAVPKKYSDSVWKRFVAACDYFFDRKNEQMKNQKSDQEVNMEKKLQIIEKIKALQIGEDHEASFNALKALIAEWNEVGFVPFKEKDKVYKAYKQAIDEQFDKLNLDQASRRLDVFKTNLEDMSGKGQQKLLSERKRLLRQYDALSSEITTSENNIGFFGNSKGADALRMEIERKIEKLKQEKNLILEKIKLLEEAVNKETEA